MNDQKLFDQLRRLGLEARSRPEEVYENIRHVHGPVAEQLVRTMFFELGYQYKVCAILNVHDVHPIIHAMTHKMGSDTVMSIMDFANKATSLGAKVVGELCEIAVTLSQGQLDTERRMAEAVVAHKEKGPSDD